MFEESDVRKLHIDNGQSPRVPHLTSASPTSTGPTPSPSRAGNPTASAHEARRFQQDITRIVKEGAPASELGKLISRCHLWLKTQAPEQHEDLRISFLLLYNLTETQRKLAAEADAVRTLRTECEDLRQQFESEKEASRKLKAERDVAITKYSELEEARADERETARVVEESLRSHYLQISRECVRLRDELKHAKYPINLNSDAPRAVDVRHIYAVPESPSDDSEDLPWEPESVADSKSPSKPSKTAMFHLSPLPVNIPSLPSTLDNFDALDDEEDEEDFKSIDKLSVDPKSTPYEPFSSIDPLPISGKTHAPRISSGLAMTVPKTIDTWESSRPTSLKSYSPPASCSSSPTKEAPLRERSMSHASDTAKPRDGSLGRHGSLREESRTRDPVDHHRRRVQLHDLLDHSGTSTSSSLPTHSYLQAIMGPESGPPRSLSSQSTSSNLSSRMSPASPATRPPLISHASSAAIQLERQRLEREKEREKEREQKDKEAKERGIERRHTVSSSSRDFTNHGSFGSIGRSAGRNTTKIYAP